LSEEIPLIVQDQDAVKPEWEFDDGLFVKTRDSLKVRKKNKKEYAEELLHEKCYKHTPDITSEELIALQFTDETLKCVCDAADKYPATEGVGFDYKDGLLYRWWIPPNTEGSMAVEQLVVPLKCRKTVLKLAHEMPLSG